MRLEDIRRILDAQVLAGQDKMDLEVKTACGSDLMSDVLSFYKEEGILLTGLVNPQVVRTAEMMDIRAIMFVRGKCPDESIIALANEKDMVLMNTKIPMYIACGLLYTNGLVPGEDC